MQTEINGAIFIWQVQTLHPDIIIDVAFVYWAVVDQDEEVEIKEAYFIQNGNLVSARVIPHSEAETSMHRFLANIREHARAEAYKKQSSHE